MEQPWQELPKKFTPALKKRITNDWHQFFPELYIWKPMSFNRLVGPLLIGIDSQIASSRESYVPTFSVHNLAREMNFLTSNLTHRLATKKTGSDDWLTLRWHDKNYREAAIRMREQALLPLEGPISLDQVIQAYKNYVEKNKFPKLVQQLRDPSMLAAWAGEPDLALKCLEWGYNVMKDVWQESKEECDEWRTNLELTIADLERLRQITRDEVIKHKLTKIPYQDFTDTTYKEI